MKLFLGGIIKAALNEYTGINVNGAFDRMITGIDIAKKGKAEILLYCGVKPVELGRQHRDTKQWTRSLKVGIYQT